MHHYTLIDHNFRKREYLMLTIIVLLYIFVDMLSYNYTKF